MVDIAASSGKHSLQPVSRSTFNLQRRCYYCRKILTVKHRHTLQCLVWQHTAQCILQTAYLSSYNWPIISISSGVYQNIVLVRAKKFSPNMCGMDIRNLQRKTFLDDLYASVTIRTMLKALCFRVVCASVCVCMRPESLWTQCYKPLGKLRQIYKFGALGDKDELVRF